MSEFNPYTPPVADLEAGPSIPIPRLELADRGTRLGASLLDSLITGIPAVVLAFGLCALVGLKFWVPRHGVENLVFALITSVVILGVELAINGVLLARHGQSVGKRICGIKIVKQDGSLPTLFDSFVKRRCVMVAIYDIPFVGGLSSIIDVLLIFRESHRCLHDELAGTLVIKA